MSLPSGLHHFFVCKLVWSILNLVENINFVFKLIKYFTIGYLAAKNITNMNTWESTAYPLQRWLPFKQKYFCI
uniref:Ovule protein n=1 Tax=Strongyloides venezuelensis TaxID=75913 RepID=A0A0K0FE03_STRVS